MKRWERWLLVGLWVATLAFWGWLKAVLLFVLILAGLFVGTVVIFGIWDAIRTRHDRGPRQQAKPEDDEIKQLRRMSGLK